MRVFLKTSTSLCGLAVLCILGGATLSIPKEITQDDLSLFGQTGARSFDPPESVRANGGDSVYDIADALKVPFYDLIMENRFTGELPIAAGTDVKVPRYKSPAGRHSSNVSQKVPSIRADAVSGLAPLGVRFFTDVDPGGPGKRFVWDFGNNRFSFDASPRVTYTHPGVYTARLITVDAAGFYTFSDPVRITVTDVRADYQGLPFITVDRVGDLVTTLDRVKDSQGAPVVFSQETVITQDPPLLRYLRPDTFITIDGGFSRVELKMGAQSLAFYLFVSPFPARLSAEPEYDWYKTQFDTGMYGNCGPASNASAIKWAVGVDLTVPAVREEIGMPYANGAVDYNNLTRNLRAHAISAEIRPIGRPDDVISVIDSGGIAIVSFNCGSITPARGDKRTSYIGRYYPDATGHYLLIKGYTLDRSMFIVYDAIPGDWARNEARYMDGVSMIGRNRFFKVDEVLKTVNGMGMIAVWRGAAKG